MTTTGFDTAHAPSAAVAHRLLARHGGSWWGVYIGGPYDGGKGWTPGLVREYAAAGIREFLPVYVGQQAGGSFRRGTLTAAQGVADAREALALMRHFGWGAPAPVVLDVEYSTYATEPAATLAYARAWIATVRKAGHRAGVYGNPPVLNGLWRGRPRPNFVWVADWVRHGVDHGLDPSRESHLIPGSWPGARFWQYTGGTNVDGVDVDISCSDSPAAGVPGHVAPPAPHPPAPRPRPHPPAPKPRWYTVRRGDTMSGIAARFHVTLHALERVNPQVKNPNMIRAGERLRLPAGAHLSTAHVTRHVVGFGETLGEIAARYHVAEASLRLLNPALLRGAPAPGAALRLPHGAYADPTSAHEESRAYVATAGDTVAAIAAAFHVTEDEVRAANPALAASGRARDGQAIALPPGAFLDPPGARPTALAGAGETVGALASRYGVTDAAVRGINPGLAAAGALPPGTLVVLPAEARLADGVRAIRERVMGGARPRGLGLAG